MRVGYKAWMKDPAKWMKKTMKYHKDFKAAQDRIQRWAQTPEGKARIKEYLLKHGYTLDENGNLVKINDDLKKTE